MTNDYAYLYLSSLSEAKRQDEIGLWQASHSENVACKQAIEEVGWVLSSTLQQKQYDGRFSPQNKTWAASTFIPPCDRNYEFAVESHPAVLDGFVNAFREAQAELKLFDGSHCDDMTGQELEGTVLVMSPFTLKESYWAPENQLWLATGGFGCTPTASGRAVYATCLGDGEQARWNRSDFIGILREEHLPDWAREHLEQLQQKSPTVPDMSHPSM